MAVNKRKILESAQKFLQKGSLDKALKEYLSLLEVDPRDSGARLKLGDIHLRLGKKDDAVAAYLKVAHQFMKDGFDAKAVALFKQIVKLAPEQMEVHVPLAELYQRLGLTSEAMSALQTATEGFQKAGRKREALELLRKAAALDPTNTTSRLKIADLLRQQGMTAEALTEYDEVAAELERGGEAEALCSVYERVLEIEPDRLLTLIALARVSLRIGANEQAHALAERAATARPDLIEAIELHAESLQAIGRDDAETEPVFRRLADLHRAHGNDERAREILQRFIPAYDLTLSGVEELAAPVPNESFPGSDLLEDLTQAGAKLGPATSAPASAPKVEAVAAMPAAQPAAAAPDADVEQLLAEASVYLRFGKRDKAIAGLEAVLARVPDHPVAREKLAGLLAPEEVGAAPAPSASGHEVASEPAAPVAEPALELAGSLADLPPLDPSPPGEESAFEFDVELDLAGGDGLDEPVELGSVSHAEPGALPGPLGSELDLDPAETGTSSEAIELAFDDTPMPRPLAGSEPTRATPEIQIPTEDDLAASFQESAATSAAPLAAESEPDQAKTPSVSVSPKRILEDLEEADFYFQQGLLDEASDVYRRVLEAAPTNPQALLRLGEIAAARGHDPAGEQADPASTLELEDATQPGVADAGDLDATLGDDLASWDEAAEQATDDRAEPSFELGLEEDDAPALADEAGSTARLDLEVAPLDAAPAAAPAEPEISHFDLAAELSDALSDDATAREASTSAAAESSESLESIFSDFKRGVRKTLTAADHETHYDLGIAYREMGLLEDAMGEFQTALDSPARRLDCLQLLGLCARDLKRGADAVAFFRQALADVELPAERRAAISFELAIALEEDGASADALAVFEEVAALEPAFPGLGERVDALRALLSLSPPAEGRVEATEERAEVYESFDDLIADAEAVLASEPMQPAPVARPPEPAAADTNKRDDDPPPAPPRGAAPRRRKISFG